MELTLASEKVRCVAVCCSVLQCSAVCVAVCGSVLQSVAVCSVLRWFVIFLPLVFLGAYFGLRKGTECCSVLQCVLQCVLHCVVGSCSVLQCFSVCVALCCSVLQCAILVRDFCAVGVLRDSLWLPKRYGVLQCVAVCCSVLQCDAVCVAGCCRVLQFVAVCCRVV